MTTIVSAAAALSILFVVAPSWAKPQPRRDAGASTDTAGDATPDGAADSGTDGGGQEVAPETPAVLLPTLIPPLPPAGPSPELDPILREPPRQPAVDEPIAARERPATVIRVILGLLLLLALAYASGHAAVQRLEERVRLSQVITAGFAFVVLGLMARRPEVGILSDEVLAELSPLLRLGLGWIGFMVGFRFDRRLLERLPKNAIVIAALFTALPFATVLGATGLLLAATERLPENLRDPVLLRDAIILGTAGAMTAYSAVRRLSAGATSDGGSMPLVARVLRLEELSGIVGLSLIAAYFRPQASQASWQLPGTGWLMLTLGLGMAVGLLMYVLLRLAAGTHELLVITLGAILFAAGFAGVVRLSPVVVCFVMGLLAANAPGSYHASLAAILDRLERPLWFLFLLIVGALWQVDDWRGWGLMVVFVVSRLCGKLGAFLLARPRREPGLSLEERRVLALGPLGPLALAIVVNAQLLYPGGSISLIVTAIVGGAIVMEVVVQFSRRWLSIGADHDELEGRR
jgi:hypothetical protein